MADPYAAAAITLFDRDSGESKGVYCYPITRVVFFTAEARPQSEFKVQDGVWVEVPLEPATVTHVVLP